MNPKIRWMIGGFVIFGAVAALSFISLDKNVVYFYTPNEAVALFTKGPIKTVKVGGMVKPTSVISKKAQIIFTLTDLKDAEFLVEYTGTPPDLFKEGAGAVVEGRWDPNRGHFKAGKILVKHSEEYRMPGDQHASNPELLRKSFFSENNEAIN